MAPPWACGFAMFSIQLFEICYLSIWSIWSEHAKVPNQIVFSQAIPPQNATLIAHIKSYAHILCLNLIN